MSEDKCCKTCKFGRVDCLDRVFCHLLNSTFHGKNVCADWELFEIGKDSFIGNAQGFVYIFSNPDMPSLLKVGMTHKDPNIRAKELSGVTGVGRKYVVEYYGKTNNRFEAEKAAHNRLGKFHHRKEFFKVDIGVAIYCVETCSCHVERIYIRGENIDKVLYYAMKKDAIPYGQIVHEWEDRQSRELKNREERASIIKWEGKVEEYVRKITGREESLFDYNKMPGNPQKANCNEAECVENYDPNIVILPSDLSKAENKAKKAIEELKMKEKEIQILQQKLEQEKKKGFFKRLFS